MEILDGKGGELVKPVSLTEYVRPTKKMEAVAVIEAEIAKLPPMDAKVSDLGRAMTNTNLILDHMKACCDNIVSMKLQHGDLAEFDKAYFTVEDNKKICELMAIADAFLVSVKPYLE
jgi:hypothetical protein